MYIRKHTLRFGSIFLFIIACLLFFSVKLVWIQFFRSSHLSSLAERQHQHGIKLEPTRGSIYDRKMRPLAVNHKVESIYANPRLMTAAQKAEVVGRLSSILQIEREVLTRRLNRNKYFVWLARKVSPENVERIKNLKLEGISFIKESKRDYPNEYLAAHIIGFAGMDNEGLEGMELFFDKYLRGEYGWVEILRDARHRELLIEKGMIPARNGFNLILTIDETIQFIAERALDKAFKQHNAKGASIVVMDSFTGEILALANRPTYNLKNFSEASLDARTNRAVVHVYEPGSVFKIVAVTAALEEEIFIETDKIYCEKGEYRVGNHILHDHVPHGTLTFREVFEQSSNIGTTKVAQKMGAQAFYKYADRFGFGHKTGIDMLGEVSGNLKPPSKWSKTSIGALPIGHEVTVTPLQLACALSAIANGGMYMKPFLLKYITDEKDELIKSFEPQPLQRVMSEDTARRVRDILKGVVETGTGKRARIEGVSIGGKTGTAQKVINGIYSHNKFVASFIGFAPVENPRLTVVVVVDEPHPSYFGGTVAAPVFREVVVDALKYLEAAQHKI